MSRIITDQIDNHLPAIFDRLSWDIFTHQAGASHTSSPNQTGILHTETDAPALSIGPSGRGGYCQRGETWLTK